MVRKDVSKGGGGGAPDGSDVRLTRRVALTLMGGSGLGGAATGSAGARRRDRETTSPGDQPWYDWNADVDADGHVLDGLGAVNVDHVYTAARDADVVVWKDGGGTFHADGHDERVASGADVLAVTQVAVDSLTEGREWKEKVVVVSPGEATGEVDRVDLPSYTTLDVPAEIHVPYPEGADHSDVVEHVVYAEDVERIEIPNLTVTGAPWMPVRIRQASKVKIGDFRFLAPEGTDTDVGLRIDDNGGAGRCEDVQVGSAYVENGGHHGVETVNVHRFQANQIIGNAVGSTALLLNTSTDATVNSVIGYDTGSEEEAYATFRLANGNRNVSVGQVVSRGGYRGMAIITDARRVSIGEVDIANPKWNGIQLVDAKDVTIGGGVIRNCGEEAVTIYSLNSDPPNEGITLTDLRIFDDREDKQQSWAIHEAGESRNNRFVDNDVRNGGSEGLIRVGSPTTVVRDNTGGGLAEGTATLAGGADPAARVEGVSSAGSSALEARIQPTEAPGASAGWESNFVWDADDEEWDLVVEWTTDPGSGTDVEVAYVVDRDQPNLAGVDTGPPSSWDPDGGDQEGGAGVVDDFEDGNVSEYVGNTGNYEVNGEAPVAKGSYSLKNTGGDEAIIGSFAGLPRYPAAGDTFAAKVASTDTAHNVGLLFGMQDMSNFYFTRWSGGEKLQIWRVENGEYNELASSQAFSLDRGTVYDYVVDWGADGSIAVELRETGGSVLGSVSASDTTWSEGGIGTRRAGMLDDVRIVEAGSGSGTESYHRADSVLDDVEERLGG